jgi:hypothetical protein
MNLDSFSHGHALSTSYFSLNATSTSSNEWLIDFGTFDHMAK